VLVIKRAGDVLLRGNIVVKLLIYADSGVGKTFLCAKAKNPLVILTERNGYASAAHANPDAMIVECHSAQDLRAIVLDAQDSHVDIVDKEGKTIKVPFDTLVVDSLTEIQRLFKDEILQESRREIFSQQDWGKLADKMRKFIRAVRDLPVHVICTALLDSSIEEASGTRFVQPMFEGRKTKAEILQYFTAVGMLFRRNVKEDNERVMQRHLMFDGPDRVMCKPCHPIIGTIIDPDIQQILDDISGTIKKEVQKPKPKPKPKTKNQSQKIRG